MTFQARREHNESSLLVTDPCYALLSTPLDSSMAFNYLMFQHLLISFSLVHFLHSMLLIAPHVSSLCHHLCYRSMLLSFHRTARPPPTPICIHEARRIFIFYLDVYVSYVSHECPLPSMPLVLRRLCLFSFFPLLSFPIVFLLVSL